MGLERTEHHDNDNANVSRDLAEQEQENKSNGSIRMLLCLKSARLAKCNKIV